MGLDKILALSVAVLGLLNFIWGFLPAVSLPDGTPDSVPTSVFGIGPAYLPVLFLIAGFLALGPWEPNGTKAPFVVAVISSVSAIAAVIAVIVDNIYSTQSDEVGVGIGLILLLIFGILQAVAAITSWLFDAGVIKQKTGGGSSDFLTPAPYGQPQGQPHQAAPQHQYPAPPGFGQGGGPSGQPGQTGQPGGYPAPPGFGGPQGPQHPQGGPGGQYGPPPGQGSGQGAPDSGSFAAQGGYPPQAPVAPVDRQDGGPDDDQGPHPDETQQVRF